MDAQENVGLPAISFSPRNSMSSGSVMLSPTTLPAEVVAEVFEVSESVAGPSRRSTSTAAGTAPDGTGRLFNWFETPMPVYDSPFSHFCTGHCRTKNFKLYLQESHLSDMADVVRFLNWFPFTHAPDNISVRFVSRLLKIPNGHGDL